VAQNIPPVADAGLSRYAAQDPVVLDGTGSFDPDNSGPLSYTWWQTSGPPVVITDANTANPMISGFVQTNEIQECEFELIVSDGQHESLPDAVVVKIVPFFSGVEMLLENDLFDPNKPTIIYFGGGDGVNGLPGYAQSPWDFSVWSPKANLLSFPDGYRADLGTGGSPTYHSLGNAIISYLSAMAPNYHRPIQTIGWSTGGLPAVKVATYLNQTYQDARYAVNRVAGLDAVGPGASEMINEFLDSTVDGEQCWLDSYVSTSDTFYSNILNVGFSGSSHELPRDWYGNSLTVSTAIQFNGGIVGGAYWSVIGPGKNLQLALTPVKKTYIFKWYGSASSGYMDFYNESSYPGRLPEPVTLVGPEDGAFVDANGAVFSCEENENAVGYQLLFFLDPDRVMDYYIISDTPSPPIDIITASPFVQTWWTVKVYDQYGSTIYADPIPVNFENLAPPLIENITTGQRYTSVQRAIDDAQPGHEIVVSPGVYQENISFKGKNLTVRSTDPNDPATVAATIINGGNQSSVVTFSNAEDANCVLAGFTITGGKMGIYCSSASPTITNCTIAGNGNADMGAGMYIKDGSSPTLVNCTFSENSASMMGGGMYNQDSSPTLTNCTFSGNSASYYGGGMYCNGGSPTLTNCILWGDIPDEILIFGSAPVITYSNIQNGFTGEGNIDADPLFADPNNGDYHLKSQAGRWDLNSQSWVIDEATSPCIDAGDPGTPVGFEPLPNGGIINMGAYGGTDEASKSPEN
jgi:predicted outer membrane repeat protein